MIKHLTILLLAVIISISAAAQTDNQTCISLIQYAINTSIAECGAIAPDEICYGSIPVEADAFTSPGDKASATDFEMLQSSQMNIADAEWGITLMNIGEGEQAASIIVFGDVTLNNHTAGITTVEVTVTSRTGANARSAPDTEARLLQSLIVGQTFTATGRVTDSSWLRLTLPSGESGWVSSDLINGENIASLEIVGPNDLERILPPMRDFSFTSGIGDAQCAVGPESGILIQSIEDGETLFVINSFDLTLRGTVFLQAGDEDSLIVHILEGEIETGENTIPSGKRLNIIAEETTLFDYDYSRMEYLPIELLPRSIIIATNWQQAVTAAKANPLAGIADSDTCTVAPTDVVNVRTGPGPDYPVRGTLNPNETIQPTGRAPGTDGRVWWRFADGAWINFDVVLFAGNCNAIPIIENIPRARRAG